MRLVLGMTFAVTVCLSFLQHPKTVAPVRQTGHASVAAAAPKSQSPEPLQDTESCTAKGYFRIGFFGNDSYHLNAISVKYQLIDPKGRRLGPKFDSEEIVEDIPQGHFDWEALDDDEDPNAPPEVPSGTIEVCNPESGVYRLEGRGMMNGDYSLDVVTYSQEMPDKRGLPHAKQFYRHFTPKVSAGAVHTVEIHYSRSQNQPTEILATLQ